jgi:hypothetical protein
VPKTTLLDIPPAEQAQMLAALRRALWLSPGVTRVTAVYSRPYADGDCHRVVLLALQCLSHHSPLSRRAARLHRRRGCPLTAPIRTTVLMPWIKRALVALLKAPPQAFGWCRTRWSCATLARALHAKHRLEVSAGTVRRWLHALGWVWKRATLVAKDNDPQRVERLARMRWQIEHLQAHEL